VKIALKCSIALLYLVVFATRANAQVVVPMSSLPSLVGEYNLSYVRTDTDVSALIGKSGSNYWNFSQPQASGDSIQRLDIVSVADGGDGGSFTNATYAEQFTGGPLYPGPAWQFYSITSGVGRDYYGFVDDLSVYTTGLVIFNHPTVDLPDPVKYGQTWKREVELPIYEPGISFPVEMIDFNDSSSVDAYGSVALPGVGETPCLRVSATDTYVLSIYNSRSRGYDYYATEYQTNYQWLVPGIGLAAEVVQYGGDTAAFGATYTNTFQRVFLYPPLPPPPPLGLALHTNIAVLTWASTSNASGYVVQTLTNLNLTNWLPVAQLINHSLSVPIIEGASQQCFRIFAQPPQP
jgi:hypothetical protein